ncbi:hypothetical protein R1sor_019658 [Riccia sorocarpa]|uniref:CRM domain-containing protein n=1 Tax=Riccia sorocarpa TaxID=122646 RepID=A0ABD3IHB3_9MARC
MELNALSLRRCPSAVPPTSRCSTSYDSAPVCHVGRSLPLSFSSLFISQRRDQGSGVGRPKDSRRFRCGIASLIRVAADEDEYTDQRARVEKKGFQLLGNKEKKELRAYAHSLGKDINVQQIGKLGITPNVVTSISDALEANEIVKVKVLENCDSEQDDIIAQLEDETGAQTVGKIGRTLLLYRASMKKLLAAEEKKKADKPKRRSKIAMSAGRNTLKSRRSIQ